jgi:hypothetical protein
MLRHLTAGDLGIAPESVASDRAATRILPLPGHRCLVGLGQPTFQSMSLLSGNIEVYHGIPDEDTTSGAGMLDHSGDGTVYRYSAELRQAERTYVHQSHGALARSKEAMDHVCAVISEDEQGAPLGGGELGLEAAPRQPGRVATSSTWAPEASMRRPSSGTGTRRMVRGELES